MGLFNKILKRKKNHEKPGRDIIVLHVDVACDTDALEELSTYSEERIKNGFVLAIPAGVNIEVIRGMNIERGKDE